MSLTAKTAWIFWLSACLGGWASPELVEQGAEASCQSFTANRELRVFKDPTLFLSNLSLFLVDPKVGWYHLMQESPLRTTLKGKVDLWLGEPREFRNFGVIARLYELAEPRLRITSEQAASTPSTRIIPIQVCGEGALGFVLEEDLQRAKLEDPAERSGSLPPSTYPNPIPE